MKTRTFLLGLAGLWWLGGSVLLAAELSGRITLVDEGGKAASAAAGDPRLAVVSFEPQRAAGGSASSRTYEMRTVKKQFDPQVLAVPRGATVRFPNQDPILHNVFSVAAGSRFDLGLYSQGPGKSFTFKNAGIVRIFCNVHHSMVGYVVVLDTQFFTSPDAGGSFRLAGLPEGGGKLRVWHPQTEDWESALPGAVGRPLQVELTLANERVPNHLNKFGKAYGRGRRDRYDG
jgi:plastocyanin